MKRIGIYVVLLVLFSTPGWWLARQFGGTYYILLMMYAPALAALASVKLTGTSPSQLGWCGTRFRWAVAAWLTPLIVIAAVNVMLIMAGAAAFPNAESLAESVDKRGMADWPLLWKTAAYTFLAFTVGIVGLTANALGEEIGWRGYLTPAAYAKWGFIGSSIFVGILWALWHLPLFWGRASVSEFLLFAIGIVAASFIYTWFRLVSGSVWPAAIMHGTHNAALIAYWDDLLVAPPGSIWIGETGYALGIGYSAAALLFWLRRRRAEQCWNTSTPD